MQRILAAAGQVWPPFVLVAGLLLIGAVAAADGVFEAMRVSDFLCKRVRAVGLRSGF